MATLGLDTEQARGASLRSLAIASAAERGFATVLCPFRGEPRRVRHSIGRGWFLIEDEKGYCLASDMGGIMCDVNLQTVWVFPDEQLILRSNCAFNNDEIIEETTKFLWRVSKYWDQVVSYLKRSIPEGGDGISVADFWCPHMAHNLWNIQTAWYHIFGRVSPARFKSIINYNNQNFFGSLEELYPKEMAEASLVQFVSSDEELFLHSLKIGGVMLGVKDEIIEPALCNRLLELARSKCSTEFLQEVAELRAACDLLVVTTIRLDNRQWLEQRDGFPKLFNELRKDFPAMGVILDGLSSDTAKGWTTGRMSMEAELEVARAIRAETLPEMPVSFAVGRTFAEAIVLCDAADCFIAPGGSGLTLYKWISNKPGLVFSNRTVLDLANGSGWSLRVWSNPAFRRDVSPTAYLPLELVQDGDVERNHFTRANFHLDWRALFLESKKFIEGLQPATANA